MRATREGGQCIAQADVNDFPMCCGAKIMCNFVIYANTFDDEDIRLIKSAIMVDVNAHIRMMYAITVNEKQDQIDPYVSPTVSKLYRAVEECGTIISHFRNPMHSSLLNLVEIMPTHHYSKNYFKPEKRI